MRIKFKKINTLAYNTIALLSLLFSLVIVAVNILFFSKDILNQTIKNVLIGVAVVLFIAVIIFCLLRIKNRTRFIITLFALSFILRIIWVLIVDTQPISDFFIMQDAAIKIVEGNKVALNNDLYFSSWVYQFGFTTYLAALYKIFNGSLLAIKMVNVLIVSIIPVVIYKLVDKLISEKPARIAALGYSLYFPSIAYTSVLTNQHLATLLCYMSLYLVVVKFNKLWAFIVIGILLGIGQIIRPEGYIILLAIFLFVVFKESKLDKKYFINLGKTIVIVAIVSVTTQFFSTYLINQGITKYEFGNRNPLWKFVEGLNYESNGSYSEEDNTLLYSIPAGEEKNNIEKKIIIERLSEPKKVATLFAKKIIIFWGANDNSFNFIYTDEKVYENYNAVSVIIEKLQYCTIIVLFAIGVFSLYKKHSFGNGHLFLIVFLGYVFIYMIIEIQIRYRYTIIPLLIIVAAYGLEMIMGKHVRHNKSIH